ncbi:MAG: class I SAM-dependent rRNA methyltransferase [Actinomycetota bacterium]|nr:class I SAM-dependent rRNA methyltransferase [Actinomycetota bacterium]
MPNGTLQTITLRKTRRLLAGHLWVFSNELAQSPKGLEPGSIVELEDMRGNFLGTGYVNPASLIAVRILSRGRGKIDYAFIKRRLEKAISFRKRFSPPEALGPKGGTRLVFGESDYLPGLVVDKYADVLSVQILTAGMEALKDHVINALDELLSPRAIALRNDSRSRLLEGLSQYKEVVKGNIEPAPVITEEGISYEIDVLEGQKTGFFLDQRENRAQFAKLVSGGRGLDLFCYSGGWGISLAGKAAGHVTFVDESAKALALARKNAMLNNVPDKVDFAHANVFDFLEEKKAAGEKFDFIVLDPPAFAKSAKKAREAVKAYKELNELSMGLLARGGLLATSSCSHHVAREEFVEMLREAGRGAGRSLRLLDLRSQAVDHPVLLPMPETEYLKCAFLAAED